MKKNPVVTLLCAFSAILFSFCAKEGKKSPAAPAIEPESVAWSLSLELGSQNIDSLTGNGSFSVSTGILFDKLSGKINHYNNTKMDTLVNIENLGKLIQTTLDTSGTFSFEGMAVLMEGTNKVKINPVMKNGYSAEPSGVTLFIQVQ